MQVHKRKWQLDIKRKEIKERVGWMTKNMLISCTVFKNLHVKLKTKWWVVRLWFPLSAHFSPNLWGRTTHFPQKKNPQVRLDLKTAGQKFLRSVFTVSIFFFNFEFSSRLCDAGSSLRLWCLASTLKSPWNHRWLFSGPTMLHIISLHFTPFLLLFLCFTDVW